MEIISRTIEYPSRTDSFRIIPLADIHLGNEACAEKTLKATAKEIAEDPHAYTVLMGDMCDWINRSDKRFDPESLPSWLWGVGDTAKAQREHLIEILRPIGHKVLAILEGNHERTIERKYERDVYSTIGEALGDGEHKLLMGPSGFLRLSFRRRGEGAFVVTMFLTHGWWGGRLMGNGGLNLERVAGWVDADIIAAGHDHKRRALGLSKLRATAHTIRKMDVHCISCGTFLEMAKYAEEHGYRPQPVGPVEIHIRPDRKEVRVLT